jgi:hypothetical protein
VALQDLGDAELTLDGQLVFVSVLQGLAAGGTLLDVCKHGGGL